MRSHRVTAIGHGLAAGERAVSQRPRAPGAMGRALRSLAFAIAVSSVRSPEPGGSWDVSASAQAFASDTLEDMIATNTVVIFSRTRCSSTERIHSYLEDLGIPYYSLHLDEREDGPALQRALAEYTEGDGGVKQCSQKKGVPVCSSKGLPRVFIRGQLLGGYAETGQAYKSGELAHWASAGDSEEAGVVGGSSSHGDDDDDNVVVATTMGGAATGA